MKRITWLGNDDAFRLTQFFEWIPERNKPLAVCAEGFGHLWTEFFEVCLGLRIQRIKQALKIVVTCMFATVEDLPPLESDLDGEQREKCAGMTH